MRIKICGITNDADARLAVDLGAHALGFIFYPRSPRYITPDAARRIILGLPPFVTPVAVVVNEPAAALHEIMTTSGCQVAQLHGAETPAYLAALPWPAVKGVSVASLQDLEGLDAYTAARALLLDTKVEGVHGGTGATFDWGIAREAKRCGRPIILAGGLTPENVVEAIAVAVPDGVDVSSRIECEPGRKDHARMRAFFAAVARASRAAAVDNATRVSP
jgi:phosphoribosylanthranilate isomerase